MEHPADGKDYCMQKWVALLKDGWGLGLATDSRTAYDAENGELAVTALRSPLFTDHYGPRDMDGEYMEQGEHEFTLYLNAVKDSTLELQHEAELMTLPLANMVGGDHRGKLELERSMASVDQPNIEITVVKLAEDGSGDIILRCHETEGKSADANITFGAVTFPAAFTPQKIRSFRISGKQVTDVNMLEETI